jgi:hypothetical protein
LEMKQTKSSELYLLKKHHLNWHHGNIAQLCFKKILDYNVTGDFTNRKRNLKLDI